MVKIFMINLIISSILSASLAGNGRQMTSQLVQLFCQIKIIYCEPYKLSPLIECSLIA